MSTSPQPPGPDWDRRYAAETYFYGTDPNDFLRENVAAIPQRGRVLSLGEGEGRNAVFLAQRGHAVTALDQSPVGLQKARQLAARHGVGIDTVVADLAAYDMGSAGWDGIISVWCHLPRSLRTEVHARAVRALAAGGVLMLEAYTPAQLQYRTGGPTDPDLMPTLADLRAELAGLDFALGGERVREIQEGSGHRGTSAVVQVIARKPAWECSPSLAQASVSQ